MRHCATRRSFLSAIGRRVRLADHAAGPHRILRLAVVVGLAGAGFCLVLALIGLVVAMGSSGGSQAEQKDSAAGPRASGENWRTSADYRSDRTGSEDHDGGSLPGTGARQARRFLAGATLDQFRGSGPVKRHKFQVSKPGDWGISWTFTCRAITAGSFTMSESGGNVTNGIELSASGPRGRGISWHLHDPGHHFLVIDSDCPWVVKVVLPRR
jgi:hypothetical protein